MSGESPNTENSEGEKENAKEETVFCVSVLHFARISLRSHCHELLSLLISLRADRDRGSLVGRDCRRKAAAPEPQHLALIRFQDFKAQTAVI